MCFGPEKLQHSSFRQKPESILHFETKALGPGLRRDGGKIQRAIPAKSWFREFSSVRKAGEAKCIPPKSEAYSCQPQVGTRPA
jgi:hypothetical protein